MRKRILILLGVIGLLGGAALILLKEHSLEIVHTVVLNSLIQKAPPEQSARIDAVFEDRLRQATGSGTEEAYLKKLLTLSQRLEKVQHLTKEEVEKILKDLAEP